MLAVVSFPISYRYHHPPPDHRQFHFLNLHRGGALARWGSSPQVVVAGRSHHLTVCRTFPLWMILVFYGRSGPAWLNFSFASKHSFYGRRFHSMVSKPSSEVSSAMVMVSTYILKPFSTNSLNNHKRRFSNFSNSDQNIKSW